MRDACGWVDMWVGGMRNAAVSWLHSSKVDQGIIAARAGCPWAASVFVVQLLLSIIIPISIRPCRTSDARWGGVAGVVLPCPRPSALWDDAGGVQACALFVCGVHWRVESGPSVGIIVQRIGTEGQGIDGLMSTPTIASSEKGNTHSPTRRIYKGRLQWASRTIRRSARLGVLCGVNLWRKEQRGRLVQRKHLRFHQRACDLCKTDTR